MEQWPPFYPSSKLRSPFQTLFFILLFLACFGTSNDWFATAGKGVFTSPIQRADSVYLAEWTDPLFLFYFPKTRGKKNAIPLLQQKRRRRRKVIVSVKPASIEMKQELKQEQGTKKNNQSECSESDPLDKWTSTVASDCSHIKNKNKQPQVVLYKKIVAFRIQKVVKLKKIFMCV